MAPFPISGLTKAQREAFEKIAIGDSTVPGASRATIEALLVKKAIVCSGDKILGFDGFGEIRVPTYEVPLHLHTAYCYWCSEQYEAEDKDA